LSVPYHLQTGTAIYRFYVDRLTRWPETPLIADITAPTIARAFVHTWIARFGVTSTITADRGSQFVGSIS